MLIAIMGDIQTTQNEKMKMHRLQFRLNIVINHLWLQPLDTFKFLQKKNFFQKYLVVASQISELEREIDLGEISETLKQKEMQRAMLAVKSIEQLKKVKY